ncbi:hypothetical protein AB0L75_20700 [Streptomyces sp. NPDC052101]|uniref:hypothetical protein n=1 Tax=Streptomyces sp. NPDC052101 TaxID=3155763 RepID=UPI003446ABB8
MSTPAGDTEEKPSAALTAYLRHTWHTRPALAAAESRLREYVRTPPGRLRTRLGGFYALPAWAWPTRRSWTG